MHSFYLYRQPELQYAQLVALVNSARQRMVWRENTDWALPYKTQENTRHPLRRISNTLVS